MYIFIKSVEFEILLSIIFYLSVYKSSIHMGVYFKKYKFPLMYVCRKMFRAVQLYATVNI